MKQIFCVLIIALAIMIACKSKPKAVEVDTEAEKAAISALFDTFYSASISKDVNTVIALLTDNSLSCGTDPSEFWNKQQIADLWEQMFADTSFTLNYSIDRREIRVAADGNSAIVVEQFIMPVLSSKIPLRSVYNVVKSYDKWMIDFISWNFIPKNEDIPKLNKALE